MALGCNFPMRELESKLSGNHIKSSSAKFILYANILLNLFAMVSTSCHNNLNIFVFVKQIHSIGYIREMLNTCFRI